ncbi:MAG: HEAT repeat domain-containing protein [Planctomycetes bacterium]|nr:HEAT repeat domain-containing protein [Planctomycetota bacterium]
MNQRIGLLAAAVLVLTLAAGLWLGGGAGGGNAPAAARERGHDPNAGAVADESPDDGARQPLVVAQPAEVDAFTSAMAALRSALASGHGAAEAASLRQLLRTDAGALAAAYAALLAADTEADLRRALAMVLGTLPLEGIDEALLAALDRFGDDEAMVLSLIAALGALRDPPDEDDVFDLEQAPFHGVPGPGGIGITVRNVIRDPAVERALGQLLLDRERRDVRLGAAAALQWSLDQEPSRTRFLTVLEAETDGSVAAILGEALSLWSRHKHGLEPETIVTEVLRAADRAGFDEYRLRLETALQHAPLDDGAGAQLRQWAAVGQPFELRSFALSTLAVQASMAPAMRASLVTAVDGDADIAMRRHAARLLGQVETGEDSIAALRRAFAQQDDWSLRATALTSLVRLLPAAEARQLLRTAGNDVDPRIVRRAERLAPQVR